MNPPIVLFLPFQCRERIGVERFLVPAQPDANREADGRFSRGDGHDEEDHDLPVRRPHGAAERDERQVYGIQHDLDRQQDRDHVSPDEHAGRPDREKDRGEGEVMSERRRHGLASAAPVRGAPGPRTSRRARTTAPSIATSISTDVTSNASAYWVKRRRPTAATELTDALPNSPVSLP